MNMFLVDDGVLSVPEDMDMQLRLLSLLENPAVIVAAAANGDVKVLKDFLTKHPDQVCITYEGYDFQFSQSICLIPVLYRTFSHSYLKGISI